MTLYDLLECLKMAKYDGFLRVSCKCNHCGAETIYKDIKFGNGCYSLGYGDYDGFYTNVNATVKRTIIYDIKEILVEIEEKGENKK